MAFFDCMRRGAYPIRSAAGLVDVHLHSFYSADGKLSPEAFVSIAKKSGLHTIVLTDHNTCAGVHEMTEWEKRRILELFGNFSFRTASSEKGQNVRIFRENSYILRGLFGSQ